MKLQAFREYFSRYWIAAVAYAVLFAILALALVWRLPTLSHGYSDAEVASYNASMHLERLLDNPINAPYLLLVRVASILHPNSYIATRAVSVVIAFGVLVLFALVLHRWHEMRTAIAGTFLFGLSALFLHTARLGTPDILYFGVFALAAAGYWLKTNDSRIALLLCFLLMSMLVYVPGLIWFIAIGFVWQWRTIDDIFKRHLVIVTIGTITALIIAVPIIWSIYRHPSMATEFLALPSFWPDPRVIFSNLADIPYHLFMHNRSDPVRWLGNVPVLDAFSATMMILGAYQYLRHRRIARSPIFISLIAVAVILRAVGSPVPFGSVLPLTYMFVAAGIAFLYDSWFSVFPRNPIARSLGWSLMTLVVALSAYYHVAHYFIGWPHARLTRESFSHLHPRSD